MEICEFEMYPSNFELGKSIRYRYWISNKFRIICAVLIALFIVSLSFVLYKKLDSNIWSGMLVWGTFLSMFFPISFLRVKCRFAYMRLKRYGKTTYYISKEEIRYKTNDFEVALRWTLAQRIIDSPRYTFLEFNGISTTIFKSYLKPDVLENLQKILNEVQVKKVCVR